MSEPTAAPPHLPLRHCYWVVPGLLLAGEHPGGPTRDKTKDRLKKLLAAGIECFVDLTKPTELPRYDTHLPFYVEYTRKAIKDHGLPGSREQMAEILEYVGDAMRAGRPVYVHCRAGIGRTGTVVGCLLVERGLSGDGALDELNRLWQQSKRSKSWAFVPETEAQASYVREWKPSLKNGGFEMNPLASAVSSVGPMSAVGTRSGALAVADVQSRAARQATGAGQARAAMQNLAAGKGRAGGRTPGASHVAGGGLAAAAAQARGALAHQGASANQGAGANFPNGGGRTATAVRAREAAERDKASQQARATDAEAGSHHGSRRGAGKVHTGRASPVTPAGQAGQQSRPSEFPEGSSRRLGPADGVPPGAPAPRGVEANQAAAPRQGALAGQAAASRQGAGTGQAVAPGQGTGAVRAPASRHASAADQPPAPRHVAGVGQASAPGQVSTGTPRREPSLAPEDDEFFAVREALGNSQAPGPSSTSGPILPTVVSPPGEADEFSAVRQALAGGQTAAPSQASGAIPVSDRDAQPVQPTTRTPGNLPANTVTPAAPPANTVAPAAAVVLDAKAGPTTTVTRVASPATIVMPVSPAIVRPQDIPAHVAHPAQPAVPGPAETSGDPDPLLDTGTLAAARALRERFVGTLFGLAVGDAVAAATQFRRPGSFAPVGDMIGGGPFDLPRGAWSDDTAMALCLAESLLECDGFDPRDQIQRYGRWQQDGYLSCTGQCLGITANTARSLALAKWRRVVFPGSFDPEQLDPEPLSRIAPIALYYLASLETTLQQAADSSRTTCQAPAVLDACRQLGRALNAALSGQPKARILADVTLITEAAEHTSNTAAGALAAAFWAFGSTDNFRDAVLRAANVGGNSDVVASVCGQLAGAHYGMSAIPPSWRNGLMQKDLIEGYADRLLAHGLVSLSA